MVNTSADDADTKVEDQPIVLPGQGQEMREQTLRPQPPAPAPRPQTPEPRPRPRTPENHPVTVLEHLGLMTPQKPRPAVPTLRKAEPAGNTSDVDVHVHVDRQLLIELAGGDSLPNVPVPDVTHPDVPPADVPLRGVPVPEARPDGSVGEEATCPRVAEEAMVVAFRLGSGSSPSCSFPLF